MASAAVTLPSSATTVVLQNTVSADNTYLLPYSAVVNTTAGAGISANNSHNWSLLLQGVVNAATSGVSLSSQSGSVLIDNAGTINGNGSAASDAGIVLLSGGQIINRSGAKISGASSGIYSAASGVIINTESGSTLSGATGINLAGNDNTLQSSGIITGTNGTAINLTGTRNALVLNNTSLLSGDILSSKTGNSVILMGSGTLNGNIGGSAGIDTLNSASGDWLLQGNVLMSSAAKSLFSVAQGSKITVSGSVTRSGSNATLVVEPQGHLVIGNGGTTGDVHIPLENHGVVEIYRSDTGMTLNTLLSGSGILAFKGVGVSNQSAYTLSSNNNTFTGNVVVEKGARLRLTTRDPTPDAHIIVNDGATLWLGGNADFLTPIVLTGNGWAEPAGPLGALRLDSSAVAGGPVTLMGNTRVTAVFSSYSGTVAGVIGDNGKGYVLEKSGDGVINLLGNNTWTGGVLLSAGTLNIINDNNLGDASGTLSFNGGTLTAADRINSVRPVMVNAAGGHLKADPGVTLAGSMAGGGSLTLDSGTLVLAGEDRRTGNTSVTTGSVLQVGGDDVNHAGQGTLSGNVSNNGTLIFNRAGRLNYEGKLSGNGTLVKQQSGTVNLSGQGSSQNSLNVLEGKLQFSPSGSFTVSGNASTAAGATTSVAAGSQLVVNGQFTQNGGAVLEAAFAAAQPAVSAAKIALDGALHLSDAAVYASQAINTTQNVLHSTTASGISGDFSSLGFSNGADYLYATGSKSNNNQDYTVRSGLTWLADSSTGNGLFTLADRSDTFEVDIGLTDRAGFYASGWDGLSLTKAGSGTLILSQQNHYSGVTTVAGGVLQTNTTDALSDSSAVVIGSQEELNLNDFNQTLNNLSGAGRLALGNAALAVFTPVDSRYEGDISGTGSLTKEGAQVLTLAGNNTFSGGMTVNDGELVATRSAALGKGSVQNNAALTLDFATAGIVTNALSGSGVLNKEGSALALLANRAASAGSVNVNHGALGIGAAVNFASASDVSVAQGASLVMASDSSLTADNHFNLEGTLSVILGNSAQPTVSAADATLGASTVLNVAGLKSAQMMTDLQNGTTEVQILQTAAPGSFQGDFSAIRIGGSSLPVDYLQVSGRKDFFNQHYYLKSFLNWYAGLTSTPEQANGRFTLSEASESFELDTPLVDQQSNDLTGWDGKTLTKDGQGTLILARQNLYSGSTRLLAGVLEAQHRDVIAHSEGLALANGSLFDMNGYDQQLRELSGEGDIALGEATLTLVNRNNSLYSGVITGEGNVDISGSAGLWLTKDQTWTGSALVQHGAFILGSDRGSPVQLATSQLTIAPDAQFGGYGTVVGSVDNQGTFAVANAASPFSAGPEGVFIIGGSLNNSGHTIVGGAQPASTLQVNGNYHGANGLMTIRTVLAGDRSASDKLIVKGDTSGTTRVMVENIGGKGAQTQQGIPVILVGGRSAGDFTLAQRVTVGSYEYFLLKGLPDSADGNWYLRNNLPPVSPPDIVDPPVPPAPSPATAVIRPEAGSYLANQSAAAQIFALRLQDRAPQVQDSSLWLRQLGSRTVQKDDSGQLKTFANSYLVQGGGELQHFTFASRGEGNIGVMLGYANSRNHTKSGESGYRSAGDINGYSSGLYSSWYQNGATKEGAYLDSWLQYSWFNAQVHGDELSAENYAINGWSGSLEAGYKLVLSKTDDGALYLTPQAQLFFSGIEANNHTEASGSLVRSPDNSSLQSRLGVVLGKTFSQIAAQEVTLWGEANWLHSAEPPELLMNGDRVALAGSANRAEFRAGIQGNVTPRMSLWGVVSQSVGSHDFHATTGMLGGRYAF